ncbi:HAD-IIA family hydrolase [Streptomyces cavernicola]|uniref:HAD-IIA family hydrolase n=1 Tax=Streptomyces cavernicola TaxID=3043613 RepID=A0ABT6SMP3_9ACTN|nr:HAD-IIA family hydrolase [Streptomyces sp. B-S-A6]MDI3409461.1 HAD-IIA family hydrolase [Streptomyces sp. B-S-A6]
MGRAHGGREHRGRRAHGDRAHRDRAHRDPVQRGEAVRAVLIDIDGVLTVSWEPLPGAVAAMERLRATGLPFALVTNTTSRTRAAIADRLAGAGFSVTADDILTAPAVTAAYLRAHHPRARCLLLNAGDIRGDLDGVQLVDDHPEQHAAAAEPEAGVVVIGGAGDAFDYAALNRVFRQLQCGASLVAMHRNLYWRTAGGLDLDTGAFLLGLEKAARVEAAITGKPAEAFFRAALSHVGAAPAEALMVGDDIESDVLAAQRAGITGVLVRTGKYLPETHRAASGDPDHVVDSFADLPDLLERLGTSTA